ncbi:TPA: GIY-YIG nuclease family protein [Klebsiella aerogenes]|nr:GIY-YIG nuclease family protein [Klebsiella aerogenes]
MLNQECFVYIITNKAKTRFKLGVSISPTDRFAKLKKSTPFSICLDCYFKFSDVRSAYDFEQAVHKRFERWRCMHVDPKDEPISWFDGYTEWFELNAETAFVLDDYKRQGRAMGLINDILRTRFAETIAPTISDPYERWLATET